jgi:pimeloyl-ACP methyl ester carboxylesterase
MILLAPAHPFFDEGDPLIRFYLTLPGRLFAYTVPWYPEWMQMLGLRRMAGPRSWDTPERLKPYRENLQTPGTISHLLELLRTWHDDMGNLRRALRRTVLHPTLILWGDADRAVPVHSAVQLRENFALSELRVLPGCGHRPAEECAPQVAAYVTEFAARITQWGWRYDPEMAASPNVAAIQDRNAALMTPSFDSGD